LVEGCGWRRSLVQCHRTDRAEAQPVSWRHAASSGIELSLLAATDGAAAPRDDCSVAWACA
jgi:hypothetical protein